MTDFEILFFSGLLVGGFAYLYLLGSKDARGSVAIAFITLVAFTTYTAVTVASEGVLGFYTNHSTNFWGVQVWYDLIIALGIALFLLAPRARAASISPVPYIILTSFTGSIGLLAMLARVLWAEKSAPG